MSRKTTFSEKTGLKRNEKKERKKKKESLPQVIFLSITR